VYLEPRAVSSVIAVFGDSSVITAGGSYLDEAGAVLDAIPVRLDRLRRSQIRHVDWILQPATFVRMDVMRRFPLDPTLHWALDWDLFIRIADVAEFVPLDRAIAGYRLHGSGKTERGDARRKLELLRIVLRYCGLFSRTFVLASMFIGSWVLAGHVPTVFGSRLRRFGLWGWEWSNRVTNGHGIPF
jgi:hypothetical protein